MFCLKREYLFFVYTVLRGFSEANGKNLYISSTGLGGVCPVHLILTRKMFALIPTPQISHAAA